MGREALAAEAETIEAAKKDPAAFEPLYTKYHEQIFRYVYQRMDDKDLAFDVTSQVFLKALQNLKRFEHRGVPFSSWLYRIALSETNKQFSKTKAQRTVNLRDDHVTDLMDELEEQPDEALRQNMISQLADLPEDELALVEMRFFEQRPFREIGEIMGIKETNAKVKLYRTLKKLKGWMTDKRKQP